MTRKDSNTDGVKRSARRSRLLHFSQKLALLIVVLAMAPRLAYSSPTVLNFESLSDSQFVTNQFPNLLFSNAIVLTAGISLNEFDFPPHSGQNVLSDFGGPISISFVSPVFTFSAFFTHAVSVTIAGFDSSNNLLASSTSLLSSNLGSFAFLQIASAAGISTVTITGDLGGFSYSMDDVTYNTQATVPEPSSWISLFAGIALLGFARLIGRSQLPGFPGRNR